MAKSPTDYLRKAKDYAFLLLKFRLRSKEELFQRISLKFNREIAEETVQYLSDHNFIDDAVFAREWIKSRLNKPYGFKKIRSELSLKGVDKELIGELITQARKDYPESNAVKQIIEKLLKKYAYLEQDKAKRRIYAYLLRRGFETSIIIANLNTCYPLN